MDWTQIVLTLGPAIVTGAVGYVVARKNADVELRRVEAENERLRAQHREDHLRNRQGTYHRLIDQELGLQRLFATGRAERLTRDEWDAWAAEHQFLLTGVVLFGTTEAARATEHLRSIHEQLYDSYLSNADAYPNLSDFHDHMLAALQKHHAQLMAARTTLLTVMRADVAPE
jgi:hypothetical protein